MPAKDPIKKGNVELSDFSKGVYKNFNVDIHACYRSH